MGIVGSELTVSTAVCPHRAAMAAPAWRAGGEVMFPWADTAAMKAEAMKREFFIFGGYWSTKGVTGLLASSRDF